MSDAWNPDDVPVERPLGVLGWCLALGRFLGIAVIIYGLMPFLLLAKLVEAIIGKRVASAWIVQVACKGVIRVFGIQMTVEGRAMRLPGALVSNHCSWLDIFSLSAAAHVFFVSKAEVRAWPLIGGIARVAGTVFIERRSSQAKRQKTQFTERLLAGDRLLFFPEGSSTDSRRLLPFKSTLFAAFFEPELVDALWIQPTTLVYTAPKGEDPRFYGWWGEMDFAPHFLMALGARRAGSIRVVFHDPVRVSDFKDRKALSRYCEAKIKHTLDAAIAVR